MSAPAFAVKAKDAKSPLDAFAFSKPELWITSQPATPEEALGIMPTGTASEWAGFKASQKGASWSMIYDRVTGRPAIVEGGPFPWIPGTANLLTGLDLGLSDPNIQGKDVPVEVVAAKALQMIKAYPNLFGISPDSLELMKGASGPMLDSLYFIDFQVQKDGIPVQYAHVVFRLNHGNLIQFGQEYISDALSMLSTTPAFSAETAWSAVWNHLGEIGPAEGDLILEKGRLSIIPVSSQSVLARQPVSPGTGLGYRLVWILTFQRPGHLGTWESKVDAHSGELLAFQDVNQYGYAHGGMYPGDRPVPEQDRPFPYLDCASGSAPYTDAAGIFAGTSCTSNMNGLYARIADTCGSIALSTATGDLNFGMSGGWDCTTPGVGGAGNTHAARTQYANINLIKMKALTYYTSGTPYTWLTGKLLANVNINDVCNAYWLSPNVNFFKSGDGCNNTGELPGVSLHEFAHGFDANDGNGSSPNGGTGEIYGDITALLQTHQSCMGGGFLASQCYGYDDTCTSCTGVRDLDYAKHLSGLPHFSDDLTSNICAGCTVWACPTDVCAGPCGYECHCESMIGTEAVYDLATRDLITWGLDQATAWQLVDRLWWASRSTATSAYTCPTVTTSSGCSTGSLWRVFRAIDDDNGNINDGTPHSSALYAAFNRHKIACSTDTAYNTDYSACPTLGQATLSAAPGNNQVQLAWTAVTNAATYYVYRNEASCDAGFTKLAQVAAPTTTYTDTLAVNGVEYYYRIQAVGSDTDCRGAMSLCAAARPLPCTAPAAPTNLTASPNGDYRIDLSWTAATGAVQYNVYRSSAAIGPFTKIGSTSAAKTTYSDTAVFGGTTYYYVVRTLASCESLNSNQASATAAGTCNKAPVFAGLVTAANGINATCRVDLTWSAGTSQCGGTLTYRVYRSTISGFTPGPGTLIGTTTGTTFQDTGAALKKTYYYIVQAVDSVSALSDGNTVQRSAYPTGPRSTVYSNNFEADMTNWTTGTILTPSATGPVTGMWERGDPFGTTNNFGTAGQPETGALGSINCLFTDQNTTAGADDVDYGEVWLRSPAQNLSAYVSAQFDFYRWFLNDHNAVDSGCLYPDGGALEVSNNGTAWVTLRSWPETCATENRCNGAGYTNAWINDVINIEDYVTLSSTVYFRFRAWDGQNTPNGTGVCTGDLVEGALDNFIVYGFSSCTNCAAPAAPTGLALSAPAANTIRLTWSGSGAYYNIYRTIGACPGSGFIQIAGNVTGTTYDDTSVAGGVTYAYYMTALSASYCESAASACQSLAASGACTQAPAFSGLSSATNANVTSPCAVNLAWAAATGYCGTGVTYNVYRSASAGFTPGPSSLIKTGITGTSYADNCGLTYAGTYYYIVRAQENGYEDANVVSKSARPSGAASLQNIYSQDFESLADGNMASWGTGYFAPDTAADNWRGVLTCTSKVFKWGGASCTTNYTNSQTEIAFPLPDIFGVRIPFDATGTELTFLHRYWTGADDTLMFAFLSEAENTWYTLGNDWFSAGGPNRDSDGDTYLDSWGFGLDQTTNITSTANLEQMCSRMLYTPCAEQLINIGFLPTSNNVGNDDGWFIDSVTVRATYGATCATANCNIVTQISPASATVAAGSDIVFTVLHTQGTPPYSYQWTENGTNITGATANTLAVNKAVAASHTYNCKVTDSSGRCTGVTAASASTGTWTAAGGIKPVPDGRLSGTAMTAVKSVSDGSTIQVTWDRSTCSRTSDNIYYGNLANVASYTIDGSICGLTASPYTWTGVPAGNLYWLIVGDSGSQESSWGEKYSGGGYSERSTEDSGLCGNTSIDTSSTCP